jgi:cold shock CspA family protein
LLKLYYLFGKSVEFPVIMFIGHIKSYEPEMGYGFISCKDTFASFGRDVFLRKAQAFVLGMDVLKVGTKVSFEVEVKSGKPLAKNLQILPHYAPLHAGSEETLASTVQQNIVDSADLSFAFPPSKGFTRTAEKNNPGLFETSFEGTLRSYSDKNGYGFITCSQNIGLTRDVFLSRPQAEELKQLGGLFIGSHVKFTVVFPGSNHPQARNVLWLGPAPLPVPDECEQEPSIADDGQTTASSSDMFANAGNSIVDQPDIQRCEYDLNRYAKALQHLKDCLGVGRSKQTRLALTHAQNVLRCSQCIRDERLGRPGVLSLLEEVQERWEETQHPCHGALVAALAARLSPPTSEPRSLLISELRFTQNVHSQVFRHGEHAGQRVDWVVSKLLAKELDVADPSMVLNVVFFHGAHRTLNNRHGVALVRYAEIALRDIDLPLTCCVRVWPLVRGLCFDDGSCQDVARKFLAATDQTVDGTTILSNKLRGLRCTNVPQTVCVHVSNLPFDVTEDDLGMHIADAGFECPRSIVFQRRKDGRSNCHGWISFWSSADAEDVLKKGLPELRGRSLRLKMDQISTVDTQSAQVKASSGWVRCRECQSQCVPLSDTLLVEDVRIPRDGTPASVFDQKRASYLLAIETSLVNCTLNPHPDKSCSFKLAEVRCSNCNSDLGNLQTAAPMAFKWGDRLGERVVHLRCASVMLELIDCDSIFLQVRKWTILASALGSDPMYRLRQFTMNDANRLMKTKWSNSGKDARFVPANNEPLSGLTGSQ